MGRIKIDLVGGPAHLPVQRHVSEVEDLNEKVKIHVGSGYEHFTHEGEFDHNGAEQVAIFRWIGRTKIAE